MIRSVIAGVGSYLPAKIITNAELAKTVDRLPGRHVSVGCILAKIVGPIHGFLVGRQLERAEAPFAMALLAMVLENPRHVFRVGDHLARGSRPRGVLAGQLDRAANRLGARNADRFSGDQFIQRPFQIGRRDRAGRAAACPITIVDPAAIGQLAPAVEDAHLGRDLE